MTYYITPSIFALSYGEDSATVMSVLNGAGMAGSVGFQSLAGATFSSGGGWAEVLRLLVGCALGGVVCTLALAHLRGGAAQDEAKPRSPKLLWKKAGHVAIFLARLEHPEHLQREAALH